jgi:hypothetical protein
MLKRIVVSLWIILLLVFADKAIAQAVIEPEVKIAQYKVAAINKLIGPDGQVLTFKNAGTFSGLANHFYGNARPTTVKALALANAKVYDKTNPKSLWIFKGETIRIPEPLILSLTDSGSNPTKMTLVESANKSVPVLRNVAEKYLGINLAIEKMVEGIVSGLKNSKSEYNLKGELVHTITFDREVQTMTLIETDVIGPSTVVSVSDDLQVRATHAKECNNLNIQILRPPKPPTTEEKVPPPKVVELPQKKLLLMDYVPEPNGQVVKIYITTLAKRGEYGPHIEAITEFRYDRPWESANVNNYGVGNQVSVYSDNNGNWWWGPAGMFNTWWGEVNTYRYNGHEVAPGVSIKYEEPWWNVKTHLYFGDIFEDGRDRPDYKSHRVFHDVFTGDFSVSSKNIKFVIPLFEEVNFVVWGRIDPDHVKYRSYWQGKPIHEKITGKSILGLRTDWEFQSLDIDDRGTTLTPGIGYEYDTNEWDWGHGPFVTLALGQRILEQDGGKWKKDYPPHKYFRLYFGVDLERQSYKFKATMFWAEAYYAYQDAQLKELLDALKTKNNKEVTKQKELVSESEEVISDKKL